MPNFETNKTNLSELLRAYQDALLFVEGRPFVSWMREAPPTLQSNRHAKIQLIGRAWDFISYPIRNVFIRPLVMDSVRGHIRCVLDVCIYQLRLRTLATTDVQDEQVREFDALISRLETYRTAFSVKRFRISWTNVISVGSIT
jgi:hypothetical protein